MLITDMLIYTNKLSANWLKIVALNSQPLTFLKEELNSTSNIFLESSRKYLEQPFYKNGTSEWTAAFDVIQFLTTEKFFKVVDGVLL